MHYTVRSRSFLGPSTTWPLKVVHFESSTSQRRMLQHSHQSVPFQKMVMRKVISIARMMQTSEAVMQKPSDCSTRDPSEKLHENAVPSELWNIISGSQVCKCSLGSAQVVRLAWGCRWHISSWTWNPGGQQVQWPCTCENSWVPRDRGWLSCRRRSWQSLVDRRIKPERC